MAWEAPGGANENAEAHSAYELPFFRSPLATVELDELVMNLLSEGKKFCLTFSILINHLLQLTLSMNNQNLFLICCREKLQKLFTSKAVVVP